MVARLSSLAAAAAAVLMTGAMAGAAPMITNGDFQTGDLSGWTTSASITLASNVGTPGNYAMQVIGTGGWNGLGGVGMPTNIPAPIVGDIYLWEFDAMSANVGQTTGVVGVNLQNGGWGGPPANGTANISVPNSALTDGLWHHYSMTWTAPDATLLKIDIHDLGSAGNMYLDNFSLTDTSVPEPTSLAMLGLGTLALLRRRR